MKENKATMPSYLVWFIILLCITLSVIENKLIYLHLSKYCSKVLFCLGLLPI